MELKNGKIEVRYNKFTPAHAEILRDEIEELVRSIVIAPRSALSIKEYEEVNK